MRTKMSSINVVLLGLMLGLVGCSSSGSKIEKVQEQINEIKKKPTYPVEPLPTFPDAGLHRYSAESLPNPFNKPVVTRRASVGEPDQGRAKEELESYPLDSLKMVGTLHKGNQTWALVTAPNGTIYRVKRGNFLGKNYGKITKIGDKSLILVETVPDGLGNWKKREVEVNLYQGE